MILKRVSDSERRMVLGWRSWFCEFGRLGLKVETERIEESERKRRIRGGKSEKEEEHIVVLR